MHADAGRTLGAPDWQGQVGPKRLFRTESGGAVRAVPEVAPHYPWRPPVTLCLLWAGPSASHQTPWPCLFRFRSCNPNGGIRSRRSQAGKFLAAGARGRLRESGPEGGLAEAASRSAGGTVIAQGDHTARSSLLRCHTCSWRSAWRRANRAFSSNNTGNTSSG